jgi:hypothetical protein
MNDFASDDAKGQLKATVGYNFSVDSPPKAKVF